MILIKLGGSVITDKRKENTARKKVVNRLAREMKLSGKELIIVHGAGSFGHITARAFNLDKGYESKEQLMGFSVTHRNVRILNNIVLEALLSAGFKAVSIPPLSFIKLKGKRLHSIDLSFFEDSLQLGLTPVTFGDVVFDAELSFSICSGDLLMVELAKKFQPEKAIFVIDEDGIYSGDPKKSREVKLLRSVSKDDLMKISTDISVTDVTGGMRGKLWSIAEIADQGIEVLVINGNKRNRLLRALLGKKVKGTTVYGD